MPSLPGIEVERIVPARYPWFPLITHARGAGLMDACGYWYGSEAANDEAPKNASVDLDGTCAPIRLLAQDLRRYPIGGACARHSS